MTNDQLKALAKELLAVAYAAVCAEPSNPDAALDAMAPILLRELSAPTARLKFLRDYGICTWTDEQIDRERFVDAALQLTQVHLQSTEVTHPPVDDTEGGAP